MFSYFLLFHCRIQLFYYAVEKFFFCYYISQTQTVFTLDEIKTKSKDIFFYICNPLHYRSCLKVGIDEQKKISAVD